MKYIREKIFLLIKYLKFHRKYFENEQKYNKFDDQKHKFMHPT